MSVEDTTVSEVYPLQRTTDSFVEPATVEASLEAPRSNALAEVLSQALKGDDKELLERGLSVQDPDLIRFAILRLPTEYVVPLLDALVSRIQKRPNRTIMLLPWLKTLLQTHTTYLMSVPTVNHHLLPLKRLIDARNKTFRRLTLLKGRLEMVLEQKREVQQQARTKPIEDTLAALLSAPMAVYDESEDDEELLEVFDGENNGASEGFDDDDAEEDESMSEGEDDSEFDDDEGEDALGGGSEMSEVEEF